MSANEVQVNGDHYKSSIQHWDFCTANRVGYLRSSVSKYITRWKKKDGVSDLRKAAHYLDKLMELEGTALAELIELPLRAISLEDFFKANDLSTPETTIISNVMSREFANLQNCRTRLYQLIEKETLGEYDKDSPLSPAAVAVLIEDAERAEDLSTSLKEARLESDTLLYLNTELSSSFKDARLESDTLKVKNDELSANLEVCIRETTKLNAELVDANAAIEALNKKVVAFEDLAKFDAIPKVTPKHDFKKR